MLMNFIGLAQEASKTPALIPVHVAAQVPQRLREEKRQLEALCNMFKELKQIQGYFFNQLTKVEAALSVYENSHGVQH